MNQTLRFLIDLAPLIQAVFAGLVFVFIVIQTLINKRIKEIANRQSAMFNLQMYFDAKNQKQAQKPGEIYEVLREVSKAFEKISEENLQRLLNTIFDYETDTR